MPRRIYTYLPETGFGPLNLLATAGAFVLGAGVLVFLLNVLFSLRRGAPAGDDPWGAPTLEWSIQSPPPAYCFEHLPSVRGRSPLWTDGSEAPLVTGLSVTHPEVLVTTVVEAEPDHRLVLPGRSLSPLALSAAVGLTVIACIFNPWGLVYGAPLCAAALLAWFWPSGHHNRMEEPR
jgi:cytochrome c oxidase subunit 1